MSKKRLHLALAVVLSQQNHRSTNIHNLVDPATLEKPFYQKLNDKKNKKKFRK